MTQPSQRDVVFTPFMLRVRAALDGEDRRPDLRLGPSAPTGVANATDEWVSLRARSEQVLAEANSMVDGRAPLVELDDEFGTGELAFVLKCGGKAARISMAQISMTQGARQAWVQLQGFGASASQPMAPADPEVLEDLVVLLLREGRRPDDG